MEKNAEYGGQQEVLAVAHVIERPITVYYETQTKALNLDNFLLIAPAQTLRDDKGELIKAGHYVLLRRATLLSQPENEKVCTAFTPKVKLS